MCIVNPVILLQLQILVNLLLDIVYLKLVIKMVSYLC